MKLDAIQIENFKCFQTFKLNLHNFDIIIGINNSGKTSILQSILFGHYLIRKCFWVERRQVHSANRTDYTFSLIPNMFVKDLWHNQKTRGKGNISTPIKFSLYYEGNIKFEFEIHYRYGGLNHKVASEPRDLSPEKLKDILKNTPLFIPASTGIIVREEYRASGVRDFLISSGRSSELLRSFLYDISKVNAGRSREIDFIRSRLKRVFGTTDLSVDWDEATDPYMKTFYKEKGNTLDLVSGGSGFIQFIQVLSQIYYRKSTLVLLDEPDAHLNPNLVYDMIRTLREYSKELPVQIVIATHSRDILDIVEPEQISIVDASQSEATTCAEGKDAAYDALGISLPVRQLAYLQMFNKVLLVEGSSDNNLLDQFGTIYDVDFKSSLRNAFLLPIKGKGNFNAYVNFFNSLEQRLSKKIQLFFLCDRDNLPDDEFQKRLSYYNKKVKKAVILERNELESYLLIPRVWAEACRQHNARFTENKFGEILKSVGENLAAGLETKFEESYAKLKGERIADSQIRTEAKTVFRTMLRKNPFAVLPGKETFKEMLKQLQDKYDVKLTAKDIIAHMTVAHLPQDLRDLLKSLLTFTKP